MKKLRYNNFPTIKVKNLKKKAKLTKMNKIKIKFIFMTKLSF